MGKNLLGISLIEALVTLAILSFGLLGLAMMQLQSMKFNTESYSRSKATWLAYDRKIYGYEIPAEAVLKQQERAYTSPIWYSPSK